ncbi:MAG TPA: isocitrate lyase/PEP mutase family protein [Myxococcota bacterium]|nr:isocitrate lyase/PEP mutase family protein [Myxococcota bacterium]
MKTAARRLRELLAQPELVVAPGAWDALTARLVEQAGFPAVYMTGAGTSLARGFPDFGLLGMSEMVENAAVLARSIGVPLLSDADTGYGNELNVTRTVREFEARGVAGIHIEDQQSPKRCGHLDGKEIIAASEYVAKIRAAVAARRDPDFVVIARTDSRAVAGFDEAVARANAALAAGADVAFVEAVETTEELAQVPKRVSGPCLLNVVPGGKTPPVSLADAQSLGYRIAILPGLLLGTVMAAGDRALRALRETGAPPAAAAPGSAPLELFRRFGADEWNALRRRFADEGK